VFELRCEVALRYGQWSGEGQELLGISSSLRAFPGVKPVRPAAPAHRTAYLTPCRLP
jgi:hypothetical protein